jgi:preprotein translocase subunit SecA
MTIFHANPQAPQHRQMQQAAQVDAIAGDAVRTADVVLPPSGLWRTLAYGVPRKKTLKGLDAAWDAVAGKIALWMPRRWLCLRRAARVVAMESRFSELSHQALREQVLELRSRFRLGRNTHADVEVAFAAIREASRRELGLFPHPVQIAAAIGMETGCIVELATGEGKTLSATLPATLAGWRGKGCHVVTVNDYLASRDAQTMAPLYKFCNVSVGVVNEQMPPHERRAAYLADITYCTNKDVAADFLRDRIALGQRDGVTNVIMDKFGRMAGDTSAGGGGNPAGLVMRGLDCAIIDEADSILIDEAVTPLIIAGEAPNESMAQSYQTAAQLAEQLQLDKHFHVNIRFREVRLTRAGQQRIGDLCANLFGVWRGVRRREELVTQALTAREIYLRGKQYIIQEGKVVIVDEFTGRAMPDRSWQHGLHQAVEAKENLEISPDKQTMARVSFQKFFRLYRKLAGMTGTASEAALELWTVYKRPVAAIPTHKPCIRKQRPNRIFATTDDKLNAVVEAIVASQQRGQPVLVGTRSVAMSDRISTMLTLLHIEHDVLNAERHAEEAKIVARAGEKGRVTVATNMAGRGTDIKLSPNVPALGGLYVIAAEVNESARIDRQLFGRSGRQGDPGAAQLFTALDDEVIARYAGRWARSLIARIRKRRNGEITSPLTRLLLWRVRDRAARIALSSRKGVLRTDDWLEEHLSFTGYQV